MGYGLEFRKWEVLGPLLQNHPLWPHLENLLISGSQWQMAETPKEDRIANLYKALSFGNHKGASSQPELLMKLVSGNVIHGYAVPLPLGKIARLPGICMAR